MKVFPLTVDQLTKSDILQGIQAIDATSKAGGIRNKPPTEAASASGQGDMMGKRWH